MPQALAVVLCRQGEQEEISEPGSEQPTASMRF
jgi:hypothetical protein